jgi:diguanylate cyclase (GGDEF)-like protein/PAS domain S-box-containing protein
MRIFQRATRLPVRFQGVLWGCACALCLMLAGALRVTDGLERAVLDALFRARGTRFSANKIAVVVIDDATVARYGSWPLRRRHYAELVERLSRDGAKTIAFDILFPTPTEDDARFAQACARSSRVIHAAAFHMSRTVGGASPAKPSGELLSRFQVRRSDAGATVRRALGVMAARPELRDGAAGMGHVNVFPEHVAGALRRIPHVISYNGALYPSLALAAAAHAQGIELSQIVAGAGQVRAGGLALPVDAEGETLVNWIGGNGTFPSYPMYRVLSGDPAQRLEPGTFRDRIVFVGSTATGAFEHHATPFSPAQPGVEFQANAAEDILTRRVLSEVPTWAQWAMLFALCSAAGALAAGRNARSTVAWTVGLVFAAWGVGVWSFRAHDVYWPLGAPILGVVATSVFAVGYQQLRDAAQRAVAEERYALAVRGANDGIWDWNLETNEVYFSPRWKAILGHVDSEVSSSPSEWLDRIHRDDLELVQRHLAQHREGRSAHFECEFRMLHRDGTHRWVLARGIAVRGAGPEAPPTRMAGSLTDVTDRRLAEEKLLKQALSDELTGLPNRALFMDRLQKAIARSRRRAGYSFAVLFLDLDRFKIVNDSLGHLVGDEMLQEVARRLESCLRPGDTVARMGGDEFTMLIEDAGEVSTAIAVAQRVQDALRQPLQLGGHDYASTASIGIALASSSTDEEGRVTPRYEEAQELLRDADTAMYRAKAQGRARHAVFDAEMHTLAVAQMRLETQLRGALERGDLQVYYQPIVDLASGQITGFEALVRWIDPERGVVPPSEFVPFAEETGLIVALDQWVLDEACRQACSWRQQLGRDISISVNLSGRQFSQPGVVKAVQDVLVETGLPPSLLRLEITEGVVMQNASSSARTLGELKGLGLLLAIDDFGTGYSSLSYLHQFPLDVLKIDRSFVQRIRESGEGGEIVETVLQLARNLGMKVVAEGIEAPEHLRHLRRIGCDFGQGYLFSKPVTAQAALDLLQAPATLEEGTVSA